MATVALWGPAAAAILGQRFAASSGANPLAFQGNRSYFGRFRSTAESEEELVICRVGDEAFEIHCHGGTAAVQAIAAALEAEGASAATAGDWLVNEGLSLIQREACQALAEAATERTALILLQQFHGRLAEELALISQMIDGDLLEAKTRLDDLLKTWHYGQHLTRPWQVVLCGPPNVGKSSLINAIVGYERAIVQDLPGTTRDVVTTHIVCDGWQIALSDTAGRRESNDPLEQAGIARATEQIERADLVIEVHEAGTAEQGASGTAFPGRPAVDMSLSRSRTAKEGRPTLVVLNKADLLASPVSLPPDALLVSARTNLGIPELLQRIPQQLAPGEDFNHAAVIFTSRQRELLSAAAAALAANDVTAVKDLLEKVRKD